MSSRDSTFQAEARSRLANGECLFGAFLSTGSANVAEICAAAGFDWLIIDLEHGAGSADGIVDQIRAIELHRAASLARIGTSDPTAIGRALDLGAVGLMFPRIESAEDVEALVAMTRYVPDGTRGTALSGRTYGFGMNPERAETIADDDWPLVIIQIETREALEDIDRIAAVEGVDVLFVGPADLSRELGVFRQTENPVFVEALRRVVKAGRSNQCAIGGIATSRAQVESYKELGMRFIQVGSDATYLARGAKAALEMATPNRSA